MSAFRGPLEDKRFVAAMDWVLQERRVDLPMPLDPTHLVLVQTTPLTIRFRRDEKRFDVDGAYDVRYEIVKKRIDKAVVRDTGERLTQPGMIAIAYSQEHEAAEYRRYLDYLRSAGFVEDETEELDLEDLQGVFGLRALRVTIGSVESRSAQEQDPTRELGATIERLTTQSG